MSDDDAHDGQSAGLFADAPARVVVLDRDHPPRGRGRAAQQHRRVDRLNLPSYTGFVMPMLTPVYDAYGAIADVQISYPCDFAAQMLSYSAYRRVEL